MSLEGSRSEIKIDASELRFTKREPKPGDYHYHFGNGVVVEFDTTGKNYKEAPEVIVAVSQGESKNFSLDRPEVKVKNRTMAYLAECVRIAAEDSGYTTLWFYPHGEKGEHKEMSERARVELFGRFGKIEPEASGHGYILKIE